jgi:hypothetical protein
MNFFFFFPHGKIALLQGMKVWGRRGWGGCGRAAEPKFGINCGCVFFSKNLTFIFMKLGKDPLPPSLASPRRQPRATCNLWNVNVHHSPTFIWLAVCFCRVWIRGVCTKTSVNHSRLSSSQGHIITAINKRMIAAGVNQPRWFLCSSEIECIFPYYSSFILSISQT